MTGSASGQAHRALGLIQRVIINVVQCLNELQEVIAFALCRLSEYPIRAEHLDFNKCLLLLCTRQSQVGELTPHPVYHMAFPLFCQLLVDLSGINE